MTVFVEGAQLSIKYHNILFCQGCWLWLPDSDIQNVILAANQVLTYFFLLKKSIEKNNHIYI